MRTTLAKLGTCAAVAFLLLTGCTSGEDQSEQEEIALDPVVMAMDQASVDPSQIEYPLDPYWPDDDHVHLMERAKAVVEQECMRRFGLELPLPTDYPPAKPFPVWDWYGLWDEGAARELGYGSPAFGSGRPFASHVVEAGAEWVPVFLGEVETFNGEPVPEEGLSG